MKSYSTFEKGLLGYQYEHLKNPRIINSGKRDAPYTSAIHFVSDAISITHPDSSFPNRYAKGGIDYLYNVSDFTSRKLIRDKSKQTFSALNQQIKRQLPSFKPCTNPVKAHANTLAFITYNYAHLNALWNYSNKPMTPYYRWFNMRYTLWNNVNEQINATGAYQIIPITLPDNLPSYDALRKLENKDVIPLTQLHNFASIELLDMQDVWKFFSSKSNCSNLRLISRGNYNKVILCFDLVDGSAVYYNLGTIVSYINEEVTDDDSGEETGSVNPDAMLRRIYNLYKRLIDYNVSMLPNDPDSLPSNPQIGEANDPNQVPEKVANTTLPQEKEKPAKVETVAQRIKRLREERLTANATKGLGGKKVSAEVDTSLVAQVEDETDITSDTGKQSGNNNDDVFDLLLVGDDKDDDSDDIKILSRMNKVTKGAEVGEGEIDFAAESDDEPVENSPFDETDVNRLPKPNTAKNDAIIIERDVPTAEKGVVEAALSLMRRGAITGNEAKRLATLSQFYKSKIKAPDGSDKTLGEYMDVPISEKLDLKPNTIPDMVVVPDKSMLETKLPNFEQVYIKKYLEKDIARCCVAIQQGGVALTGYTTEVVKDASGAFMHITLTVTPTLGIPSNLHIKVPVIKEDGTYQTNGSVYRLRNQRTDVPIRKIKPDEVTLSSNYTNGKIFVIRGTKQVHSFDVKLFQAIKKASSMDDSDITWIGGNFFDESKHYPRDYSSLTKSLRRLTIGRKVIIFDKPSRDSYLEKMGCPQNDTQFIIGFDELKKCPIIMNDDSSIIIGDEVYHDIIELCGLESYNIPRDYVFINVFGTQIPLGLALMFYKGLYATLETLGIEFEISPKRDKSKRGMDYVKFNDGYLYYDNKHRYAPIINSLNTIGKPLHDVKIMELEHRDNFTRIFKLAGFNIGHMSELDNLIKLFIDPITADRLTVMKEPTEFYPLLIRAAELLKDDFSRKVNDLDDQIIRGYDRIPGMIYGSLSKVIADYNTRTPTRRSKIGLDNYDVWKKITTDPTVMLVEGINPIHNRKEKEALTFTGLGGRSKETMSKPTRVYLERDKGVVSESSKDSGDVGIEATMVYAPKISNFYGFTDKFDDEKDGVASLVSTNYLLNPFSEMDDPIRSTYSSIQSSSAVPCIGGTPNPLKTGMELTIAHNIDKMFAFASKASGEITELSETHVRVKYDNDELPDEVCTIGTHYGKAKGHVYPHPVICDLPLGYKFKEGEIIAFNTNFFERDILDETQVAYKCATIARTAFYEGPETDEDSSVPSPKLAKKLTTMSTDIKEITVEFSDDIRNLVRVGDSVELGDILCNIVNKTVAETELFSDKSLDLLNDISADSPTSKHVGKITHVECFYNGELEDMSESLRRIVSNYNKYCRDQHRKTMGDHYKSGLVTNDFKVGGTRLERNRACIRVYITGEVSTSSGDKATTAHQLKSTFADVMKGSYKTARDGQEIELLTSYLAANNRKVRSPDLMGMCITLCKVKCDEVCQLWFNE